MNLVIADTQESRKVRRKATKAAPGVAEGDLTETEETRTLGLCIVRGANIVSVNVTDEPPADPAARLAKDTGSGLPPTMSAGPGISKPAGRGAGIALQGPAAGVSGPGFGAPPSGFGPPPGFGPPGMPPGMPPGFAPPGFMGRGGPPRESRVTYLCLCFRTDSDLSWFPTTSRLCSWLSTSRSARPLRT